MLIIDCEIKHAVPTKNLPPQPGIKYCSGWTDFAGMGIACIATYNPKENTLNTFTDSADDLLSLNALIQSHHIIAGFNILKFDRPLLAANNVHINPSLCYDLLVEIWRAVGLSPDFKYPSHAGFSLNALSKVNLGLLPPTTPSANIPILWQQGHILKVKNHCTEDVLRTALLLNRVIAGLNLRSSNPSHPHVFSVRSPYPK